MSDIEPPKPKSNLGRKKGVVQEKKYFSKEVKAKQAAKRSLKAQDLKIRKAHDTIQNAKKRKQKIVKANEALQGSSSSIMVEDEVKSLPPTVKDYVEDNVLFRPNEGPQTQFLAAPEREVFYGGARGGGK